METDSEPVCLGNAWRDGLPTQPSTLCGRSDRQEVEISMRIGRCHPSNRVQAVPDYPCPFGADQCREKTRDGGEWRVVAFRHHVDPPAGKVPLREGTEPCGDRVGPGFLLGKDPAQQRIKGVCLGEHRTDRGRIRKDHTIPGTLWRLCRPGDLAQTPRRLRVEVLGHSQVIGEELSDDDRGDGG